MCRDRAMSTGEGIVRSRRRPSIRGSLRSKARSAPPAGGGGGIMAGLQTLLQAFPNLGRFSPSFSKESFGGFVGFQRVTRVKNLKRPFQIFFAALASFWTHLRPHRAAFRRRGAARGRALSADGRERLRWAVAGRF